ncbi:MAG: sulfite exporter TauE/SafE family protein [Caldimicrobium sp.]|nr:sulfite exporter TauE/SafE family protein [Caldimicrobium sp.]MCX7873796.1 sulfite exporter TauE/SafE family protein [Caldimicrobium sp.]MDW8094789.1 sulfite exporter TauE/SafE family protein [Caldimicrobium sp.]
MENFYLIALVLFFSGLIHGLVGFAFALTALPLLALFTGVKQAVPLMALYSLTINVILLVVLKERKIFKIPLRFFLFLILGVILGIRGFTLASEFALRVILFIAILCFLLWEIIRPQNHSAFYRNEIDSKFFSNIWGLLVALLAGLLGGLLNTPGPPLIMYLSLLRFNKDLFKATLQLILAFIALNAVINHLLVGNITFSIFMTYVYLLPFVLTGMFIGQKMYSKLSNRVYYYFVNIMLFVTGILLLLKKH